MTLRISDLQSDSDLDSIRNSCEFFVIAFLKLATKGIKVVCIQTGEFRYKFKIRMFFCKIWTSSGLLAPTLCMPYLQMARAVSIIFHFVRWDAHLECLSLSTSALWSLDRAQIINISLHHGRGLHKSRRAAQNKKLLVPSAATKIYTGLPRNIASWEQKLSQELVSWPGASQTKHPHCQNTV